MKIVVITIVFGLGCISCKKVEDNRALAKSNLNSEFEGYTNADPEIAKSALLSFREQVFKTEGFSGALNVHDTLLVSDARLFTLLYYSGQTNEAFQWYRSYLTNLNHVRDRESRPPLYPSPADVLRTVDRLDANFDVGWKKNLSNAPPGSPIHDVFR